MSADIAERASIRVVVIDDHDVLRAGLKLVLKPHGIEVVGETGLGSRARELVAQNQPDVAIVDIRLPDADGIDLVQAISKTDIGVVVYSAHGDPRLLCRAVTAGAQGYVLKHEDPDNLAKAVIAVSEGRGWISHELRGAYLPTAQGGRLPLLSPRECEILGSLSRGLSTAGVATALTLSPHTVRTHVKNAMRKLDANTRAHAVAIAMRDLTLR